MEYTEIIGLVASVFLAVSFVPQVLRVFQMKSAREISILFTLFQLAGLALWLTYGSILKLMPVLVCNSLLAIFVLMLLFARIKYGRQAKEAD